MSPFHGHRCEPCRCVSYLLETPSEHRLAPATRGRSPRQQEASVPPQKQRSPQFSCVTPQPLRGSSVTSPQGYFKQEIDHDEQHRNE